MSDTPLKLVVIAAVYNHVFIYHTVSYNFKKAVKTHSLVLLRLGCDLDIMRVLTNQLINLNPHLFICEATSPSPISASMLLEKKKRSYKLFFNSNLIQMADEK